MEKEYQHIIVEKYKSFWQIWLNRPEKHNAINDLMMDELTEVLKNVEETKTRLLVLRGKGKTFCAGADLSWMKQAGNMSYEENRQEASKLANLLFSLYNLPVPLITFVHGAAYGGALGFISASDFVYVDPITQFSFSEVRLGLSPSTIMPYVINKIGRKHAKELIFSGKIFGEEEALSKNLVDKIVGEDEANNLINDYVDKIEKAAPGAIKESKRLINLLGGDINKDVIELTIDSLAKRRNSPEAIKGIEAFFNKQKVTWN